MSEEFRVTATSLNLRGEPLVRPSNRLAVLAQGCVVTKLAESPTVGWWRVRATVNGATIEGFVNASHLAPVGAAPPGNAATAITAVHMPENVPSARRDHAGSYAHPIGEPGRPAALSGTSAARRTQLLAIIDWLDVETGARWRPGGGKTFCNIYAYDVCYLAGVYLPRVWWKSEALIALAQGQAVTPDYDRTVSELNANALCNWLEEFGQRFGWQRTFSLDELQAAANDGKVATIVAHRTDPNRSGHIQIIAPEHGTKVAKRSGAVVTSPLQSQAGTTNFRYSFLGTTKWWAGSQFRKHGMWINA